METEQEQFTLRMLRRASEKKDGDQTANFTSLRRRLNILKAIEERGLQNGRVTDSKETMNMKEEKKTKKEFKSQFLKHSKGAVKKNYISTSNSWTRAQTPFLEPVLFSTMENQEPEEKVTKNQFLPQRYSKFTEQKEEEILIKEARPQEKKSTKFQESYPLQSTSDSNQVPVKPKVPNSLENMKTIEAPNSEAATAAWEATLKNCINTYSAIIGSSSYNISNKKETNSINFDSSDKGTSKSYHPHKNDLGDFNFPKHDLASPKNDLSFARNDLRFPKNDLPLPKGDFTFLKPDLHFPRPYQLNEAKVKPFKSKLNESNSSYVTETSTNDTSLSSYLKSFENREATWQKSLSNLVSKQRNSPIEDWKDPSEIFSKNIQEAITPQLLRVEYKVTPVPETISEFKNLGPDSEITEYSPLNEISDQKDSGPIEESETESGSMFSLSSAIKNLDEEIENLQLRPEAEDLEKAMETPKKFFPLTDTDKPLGITPRKLFEKDPENEDKEVSTPEDLKKIETTKSSSEAKYGMLRRHSSIFGFKTPKSWRPKPNLESTRKASSSDLTKKTISPSQIGSTLSSINPNTPTTPEIVEKKSPNMFENSIPFEVEQFLEDALGEELYNTSVTYANSDMRDRTNSNLNASELISEERTPPRQNRLPRTPKTEPSRHSTLNRTLSAYKSLSQRIKKKFRPSLKESVKQGWNPYLPINTRLDDRLQVLLQEINIQQTLIYQASKALDFCRTMKEFTDSPEQVESDRLILVASLRKQALFQEIKNVASKSQPEASSKERAEITLKDISLPLKEGVWRRERQNGDVVEWFVILISQGLTVWATHATTCPINSPRMYFPGGISIPKLTPDFKISLKVYSLKVQSVTYNHEEKYHIQKEEKIKVCPSPTKLLKRTERPLSPRSHEVKFSGIRESSFIPMGIVNFELHDLSLYPPWPLRMVPKDSVLQGTVDLSLTCKLHLSVSHAGFLTHGDEIGGFAVWNRRWCVLEGHTLMFWNYPREEEIKNPLLVIDLMDCVTDEVNTIDRTRCAKPRTFVIETSRHRNATDRDSIVVECRQACTIIRHLLQCDTTHDLIEWMTKLNHILSALREWNVIGTVPRPRESDL